MPLWQRMERTLSQPKTYAELADTLGAKVESLEKVVTRDKGRRFTRVSGGDGIARIALVSSRGGD